MLGKTVEFLKHFLRRGWRNWNSPWVSTLVMATGLALVFFGRHVGKPLVLAYHFLKLFVYGYDELKTILSFVPFLPDKTKEPTKVFVLCMTAGAGAYVLFYYNKYCILFSYWNFGVKHAPFYFALIEKSRKAKIENTEFLKYGFGLAYAVLGYFLHDLIVMVVTPHFGSLLVVGASDFFFKAGLKTNFKDFTRAMSKEKFGELLDAKFTKFYILCGVLMVLGTSFQFSMYFSSRKPKEEKRKKCNFCFLPCCSR
ncbi:MAG: uncharacterized protein A8A55_1426 [Amphiamblys sp. WSBS2006]|nr:MAG: uncharacterized protein A8A55_1426 [Amphiamblys sp. WSBS2006]